MTRLVPQTGGIIRHLSWPTGLLALALLWAPLPFASAPPWAAAMLASVAFVSLSIGLLFSAEPRAARLVRTPALLLVALAAFGLAQALPWPRPLAAWLSSGHVEAVAASAALLGATSTSTAVPLSLAPRASAQTAWALLALAATLVAAAMAGSDRRGRRVLLFSLLGVTLFEVLFGARHWFDGATEIWGVEVPNTASRLRGTFVNPDHFALALEIALAVVFAWGYRTLRRSADHGSAERRILALAPPLLLWLLFFAALTFTGSRAGLVGAVAAPFVQGALLAWLRGRTRLALLGIGAAAVGVAGAATLGFEAALGRLLGTSAYELGWNVRLEAYQAAFRLWSEFPFLGTGLGSFQTTFPLVQPAGQELAWRHLHNDWLELLVTAGLVGFALFALGLWAMVRRLVVVLRRGERGEDRSAALAALGALVAVGVHSLLDFGLTMPANAFTLAVVVGAAAGARIKDDGAALTEGRRRPLPVPAAVENGYGQTVELTSGPAS